jgi:hypothetical protein
MTTLKIPINGQSKVSLQPPATEYYRNFLIFGAPQFPGTTCIHAIIILLPAVRGCPAEHSYYRSI